MAKDPVQDYGEQVRAAVAISDSLKASGLASDVELTGHIVTFRVSSAWIAIAKVVVRHQDDE